MTQKAATVNLFATLMTLMRYLVRGRDIIVLKTIVSPWVLHFKKTLWHFRTYGALVVSFTTATMEGGMVVTDDEVLPSAFG